MKNAVAINQTTEVRFEVATQIIVSDPCYLESVTVASDDGHGVLTWGNGMHKVDAREGEWQATIETYDNSRTHGWGERVHKLVAEHTGGGRVSTEQIGYAAVDSGQMFIGAIEGMPIDYEALLALYYNERGRWQDRKILACQTGVVSSTGYGDGEYPVTVGHDRDGLVVYIEVEFIGDED